MQLGLSTWAEVERYLAESDGIIIPIGSTEQHGPNGLIGTDAICAEAVAHGIGDQTGAVVAPVLAFGMAQHHMGFPGTVTLRASTLILVLRDVVTSLAAHGFRRFYFVNGHGGNIAIAHSAFAEIYAQSSLSGEAGELRCTLRNWWLRPAVTEIVAELYGDREGHHATPSEVALTQHLHPAHIKRVEMDPAPPADLDFADAVDFRRRFPDGRIGSHPALARPEHGQRLLAAVTADLAEDFQTFVEDSA